MKKKRMFFLILMIFFLCTTPAYARAGGGGGGSSGSGGSGGGGNTSHVDGDTQASTPAAYLIDIIPIFLIASIGSIPVLYHRFRIYKKSHVTHRLLKTLDDNDAFWNTTYLQQQIENIYYTAQTCWSEKNIEPLKSLLSEELYENWRMKMDWMDVRGERNILKNVKLLSSHIVGVYDSKNDEHDMFWVAIRGKMVDYTIREADNTIIEGNTKSHAFMEYWKFERRKDALVLSEIRQKDEIDVDAFVNLSEEQHEDNGSSLWRP